MPIMATFWENINLNSFGIFPLNVSKMTPSPITTYTHTVSPRGN